MAPLPIDTLKAPPPAETLEQRFRRLAATWLTGTAHLSSTSEQVAHPAFEEIVSMGEAVIPMLLRELEQRSGHWHRALKKITHADPVLPAERGQMDKITEAWLRWGREQGYRWK